MFTKQTTKYLLPALATAALIGSAHAAVITWSAPQDIAGDSDVSTNGTGVLAYNGNGDNNSQTVNGVTFGNDGNGPGASYAYTVNGVVLTATGYNGAFSPFEGFGNPAGTAGDYATLLDSGVYDSALAGGAAITFSGLTPGQDYEVQIWLNDARTVAAGLSERTQTFGGAANAVVQHKQYVIGTFTADGTSQTIDVIDASASNQFNAIQLRDVTIPEPGTMALLGLGGIMMYRRRRA